MVRWNKPHMNCQVQSMWLVEPLFLLGFGFWSNSEFLFFCSQVFWGWWSLALCKWRTKSRKALLGRCDPNCGKPYESNKITHDKGWAIEEVFSLFTSAVPGQSKSFLRFNPAYLHISWIMTYPRFYVPSRKTILSDLAFQQLLRTSVCGWWLSDRKNPAKNDLHAGGMTDLFRHESMVVCVKLIPTSRNNRTSRMCVVPSLWLSQLGYSPKGQ